MAPFGRQLYSQRCRLSEAKRTPLSRAFRSGIDPTETAIASGASASPSLQTCFKSEVCAFICGRRCRMSKSDTVSSVESKTGAAKSAGAQVAAAKSDLLSFGCYRWQNHCQARAISQRLSPSAGDCVGVTVNGNSLLARKLKKGSTGATGNGPEENRRV